MIRIGVDFGGTKIEAAAIDPEGQFRARVRAPTPRDYAASLAAVRDLVEEAERQAGGAASGRRFVGVATPGSISPKTGLIRNANSQWLNGTPFREDLAAILGTGCGGGVVTHGRVVEGLNAIAGEWGHAPLPWPQADEHPGSVCWCGRRGCLELYVSGTGFEADHRRATGRKLPGLEIAAAARQGDPQAGQALDRYVDRLGRGLAMISNIIDPDVIVLGGGMSNVPELYARVPAAIARWIFSDVCATPVVAARFGDSSGVRGAALLWGVDEMQ